MAKSKQNETANVASILAAVAGNIDPSDAIRDSVRSCFDEAIRSTRSFDQALVVVFSQGIELGLSSKPKRTRKPKANGGGVVRSEGADAAT